MCITYLPCVWGIWASVRFGPSQVVLEHFPTVVLEWWLYMIYKLPHALDCLCIALDISVGLKHPKLHSWIYSLLSSGYLAHTVDAISHQPPPNPRSWRAYLPLAVSQFSLFHWGLVHRELMCVFDTTCSSLQGRAGDDGCFPIDCQCL